MLKKILITAAIVLLLAAAALAYFVVTFDAERYRPLLEQKVSTATGLSLRSGHLRLAWRSGLALEASDIQLSKPGEETQAPIQVQRAGVVLEIAPLLRGQVRMGALEVSDWTVRIIRRADGRLAGAADLFDSAQKTEGGSGGAQAAAFFVSKVRLLNGKTLFVDEMANPAHVYLLSNIDLELNNLSPVTPAEVTLRASFLSHTQNLILAGRIRPDLAHQRVILENFKLETDLAELDADAVGAISPDAKTWLADGALHGQLSAGMDSLTVGQGEVSPVVRLELRQGSLRVAESGKTFSEITLRGLAAYPKLTLEEVSARLGQGKIKASGKFQVTPAGVISGQFESTAVNFSLAELAPEVAEGEPQVEGQASFSLEGVFAGKDGAMIAQNLQGNGQISIKDGVIRNLNVIREIINKLALIPGLREKFSSRLSADYQKRLDARDTYFVVSEIPLQIANGTLSADPISLSSDSLEIFASVQIFFSGPVSGRGMVAIDSEFSEALSRSINELDTLRDTKGRMLFPLVVRGTAARPEITLDFNDIGQRLAVAATQQVLSGLLGGKKKTQAADSGQADSQTVQNGAETSSSTAQDPVAGLLGALISAAEKRS